MITVRLFAYGTLLHLDVQLRLFGRVVPSCPATLPGYARRLEGRYFVAEPEPAGRLHGGLLVLSADDLAAADRYEGGTYQRILLPVESTELVWCYVGRHHV